MREPTFACVRSCADFAPGANVGAAGTAPAEIEAVVMSCLAKNPADRPASAMDLAENYDKAMALANGELTEDQVREIVVHLAHYVGWPLATDLSAAAERVIARRNPSPG